MHSYFGAATAYESRLQAADAWRAVERRGELRAGELFERRCPVLER
jgi:hypothetical protein